MAIYDILYISSQIAIDDLEGWVRKLIDADTPRDIGDQERRVLALSTPATWIRLSDASRATHIQSQVGFVPSASISLGQREHGMYDQFRHEMMTVLMAILRHSNEDVFMETSSDWPILIRTNGDLRLLNREEVWSDSGERPKLSYVDLPYRWDVMAP